MAAFEFAQSYSGENSVPAIAEFPVATTQTLKVGDPVMLGSGKVTAGAAGTFGRALGVMAQDATSLTAGTLVKVYVAKTDQVWKATASANATSHVLAARSYDLTTGGVVDVADTTGGCIQIVRLGASTTEVYVAFAATEF
jgi:predicted RecA/RadA family phage recombinase